MSTAEKALGGLTGLSSSWGPAIEMSGTLDEAFPDADPNFVPLGSLVLIQLRLANPKIKGSDLELPDEVVQTMQQNTQVGKVIACGPLAFHNRQYGQPWPEGAWVKPGDFVRVPKFGGDRWEVKYRGGVVMFMTLKDLELGGRIPRPLDAIAYV